MSGLRYFSARYVYYSTKRLIQCCLRQNIAAFFSALFFEMMNSLIVDIFWFCWHQHNAYDAVIIDLQTFKLSNSQQNLSTFAWLYALYEARNGCVKKCTLSSLVTPENGLRNMKIMFYMPTFQANVFLVNGWTEKR